MPILNYRTRVDAAKTVAEIQHILGAKGASHVSVEYAMGKPKAITFGVEVVKGFPVNFRLPCNVEGVRKALERARQNAVARDVVQCERIAWRIVKDWVEAQMALVEAGQAEVAEVFMPYALHKSGQTLFQAMKNKQLQLSDGGA